jgi:inorganic pyrophosphatase
MALPEPECGLVISYSYLWKHESDAGRTEGLKDRPCAIVLAIDSNDKKAKIVTVVPITHTPPNDPAMAIEIPPKVKQHLGLDAKRSWIVLDEFNEFTWPGYDLRPVPGMPSRYDYGFLPPALFAKIIDRVLELRRTGRAISSPRDSL